MNNEARVAVVAMLMILLVPLGMVDVQAAPLDAEACAKLTEERASLVAAGIPADMAQGPDWAKNNLTDERLRRVARFLTVDEQLSFRCGLAKQRIALPTTVEGGEELLGPDGQAIPPAASQPAPGAAPAPKKASREAKQAAPTKEKAGEPRKRARKKAADPKTAETNGAGPEQAKAKPASRPRKKADDAYRPPARAKAAEPPAAPAAKQ